MPKAVIQHCGWQCHGSLRRQAISSYGIVYVCPTYSCLPWGIPCAISVFRNDKKWKYIFMFPQRVKGWWTICEVMLTGALPIHWTKLPLCVHMNLRFATPLPTYAITKLLITRTVFMPYYYEVTVTSTRRRSDYELTKTLHTSPSRASYGVSYVSILEGNDLVIKGFDCTYKLPLHWFRPLARQLLWAPVLPCTSIHL